MNTKRTFHRISPQKVEMARIIWEAMGDNKKGAAQKMHQITGISTFSACTIMKAGFDYDKYRELTRAYGDHIKAKKLGFASKYDYSSKPKEVLVRDGFKEGEKLTDTNYLYRDKLVQQMGELVSAVKDLVDAWRARPGQEFQPEFPVV